MKRYKMPYGYSVTMQEDIEGEWIKYGDLIESESLECNCLREAEQPTGLRLRDIVYCDRWVCPVHGYKKI